MFLALFKAFLRVIICFLKAFLREPIGKMIGCLGVPIIVKAFLRVPILF